MVEFVLLAPVLVLMVTSVADLAWFFQDQIALAAITRSAARYASVNPTAWSTAASPNANTIEGVIMSESNGSGPFSVTNQDMPGSPPAQSSWIVIKYFDSSTSPPTQCGHYSVTGPPVGFANDNSYANQASCVKAGNIVEVDVGFEYHVQAPSNAIPIQQALIGHDSEFIQ